jgi:uncharacterized protein (DUF983 family)
MASGPVLRRGLTRRCPQCGAGGLFRRWFWMVERCPGCSMRLEREPGGFLGAYCINFFVTEVVLGIWLVAAFSITHPDEPMALIAGVAVAICVVVPLLGYPFSKTTWLAIHLAMGPLEPDEEADRAAHHFEQEDS